MIKKTSYFSILLGCLAGCGERPEPSHISVGSEIKKVEEVGIVFEFKALDGQIYCISKSDLENVDQRFDVISKSGEKIQNTFHSYIGDYQIGGINMSGGLVVFGDKPVYYTARLFGYKENFDQISKVNFNFSYFQCKEIGKRVIKYSEYRGSAQRQN